MKRLIELLDQPAHTPGLVVVLTPSGAGVAELLAGLLQAGDFSLVAGCEWRLPAYDVAKFLHWDFADLDELFDVNRLARAPSCFQLVDILQRVGTVPHPLYITDFLFTFTDIDLRKDVRWWQLQRCIKRLKFLSQFRRATVIVRDGEGVDFGSFFPDLEHVANEILRVEPEGMQAVQPSLM